MTQSTLNLSDHNAIAQAYARDGYFIAHKLLTPEECATLKAEAKRVVAEHGRAFSSVFVGASVVSPIFRQLADDPRFVDLLAAIMPDGIAFMSDKVVFKSIAEQAATPWHADAQYWRGTRSKLSVWIPLDDASRANGTLTVVRGSHLREWQMAEGVGINQARDFNQTVVSGQWAAEDERVCEIERGSAIFFSDRLLHASTPNTTGADRYTIISTYQAPVNPEEPFDLHFEARHTIRARA